MKYATTFTIAVGFLCIAAAAPQVIFVSPCECQGFHGKTRWVTKTDQAPVPSDDSAIQPITPKEWEAFMDDVQQTLDKFKVPAAEQAELKEIVDSTYGDIVVGKPTT